MDNLLICIRSACVEKERGYISSEPNSNGGVRIAAEAGRAAPELGGEMSKIVDRKPRTACSRYLTYNVKIHREFCPNH